MQRLCTASSLPAFSIHQSTHVILYIIIGGSVAHKDNLAKVQEK